MEYITNTLGNLVQQTAFLNLTWGNYIMIAVACFFLYLAIKHGFEPLLLVPIAFGMLLVNIYPDIMLHAEDSANGTGGLLYYFFQLDEWSILPSLIFMGVGAMTDFGPLIANRRASSSVRQHSLVFSQLILARWLLVSLIRQQLLSPSSVEQTDRHPSSLQVSSSRRL